MNPNINELPKELKFKVGDVIRKINAGAYDTKMIVVRIEKDYYLCDNIGKYSSSTVSIAEQDNYKLVKESESKVSRNNGLLNEFQAEHDSDDWTLTNAILWGMQKQKQIDIDERKRLEQTPITEEWLKAHGFTQKNYNEQKAVRELCEQIGYGNVMDIASREWQAHLEKCGLPTEGAHKPAIVTDNHVYANDKVYVSIDKACKWLRQHAISVINIEAFRKAMEK